jgi:hypothetical protein
MITRYIKRGIEQRGPGYKMLKEQLHTAKSQKTFFNVKLKG